MTNWCFRSRSKIQDIACVELGVLIITNPQLVFFWTDGERGFDPADFPNFNLGVVFALGHSISSGFAYLFMRKMGTLVDPNAQTFQFGLLGILMGIPMLLCFDNNLSYSYDVNTWLLMAGIALFGFSS